MHNKNWTRRAAVAATLGLLAAASATAQQRIIRIIVPFGPGAVQDTIARTFNNELGQVLGASVIVENRAGAGGTIVTAMVAKAPPDGNTLVLAAASHTLAGHLSACLWHEPAQLRQFINPLAVPQPADPAAVATHLAASTALRMLAPVISLNSSDSAATSIPSAIERPTSTSPESRPTPAPSSTSRTA